MKAPSSTAGSEALEGVRGGVRLTSFLTNRQMVAVRGRRTTGAETNIDAIELSMQEANRSRSAVGDNDTVDEEISEPSVIALNAVAAAHAANDYPVFPFRLFRFWQRRQLVETLFRRR